MLYEFQCEEGHLSEYFMPMKERNSIHLCKSCGQEAKRIISASTITLEGITGDFPKAADKFARVHEKAGKLAQP